MDDTRRTWKRCGGTDKFTLGASARSDDGYTVRPMSPREAGELCRGAASFTGPRVYVVYTPDHEPLFDHPTLVCGSTIVKAQEALARYERVKARDAAKAVAARTVVDDSDDDPRMWICMKPAGHEDLLGVVDEEAGGVVAYAITEEMAAKLCALLADQPAVTPWTVRDDEVDALRTKVLSVRANLGQISEAPNVASLMRLADQLEDVATRLHGLLPPMHPVTAAACSDLGDRAVAEVRASYGDTP